MNTSVDLLGVVEDGSPLRDSSNNAGKVVVCQHHVGCMLGHSCAGAHGNADVSLLQSWSIVHSVASHGHHMPLYTNHQAQYSDHMPLQTHHMAMVTYHMALYIYHTGGQQHAEVKLPWRIKTGLAPT